MSAKQKGQSWPAFYTDTFEIERVIEILGNNAKAGDLEGFRLLIRREVAVLQGQLAAWGEDFSLLFEAEDTSDILHAMEFYESKPFVRPFASALAACFSVLDWWEDLSEEDVEGFLKELDVNLRYALLSELEELSYVEARRDRGRKKGKRKKHPAIMKAILDALKRPGNKTANDIWEWIENSDTLRFPDPSGRQWEVYIEDERLYQILTNEEMGRATTDSIGFETFRTYVREAKKIAAQKKVMGR